MNKVTKISTADSATKNKKGDSEMATLKKQIKSTLSFVDRTKAIAKTIYRVLTVLVPAGFGIYLLLGYRADVIITTLAVALAVLAVYNIIALSWKVESDGSASTELK